MTIGVLNEKTICFIVFVVLVFLQDRETPTLIC
jgi:hypothetical protein